MRRLLVYVIPCLTTAALVAGAEGLLRLTLPPADPVRYFMDGGLHAHDEEGSRTFMGDPDLGWKLRPGLRHMPWLGMPVTTTKEGFRADREFPSPKRGPRVVCVGDSVTFGYGIIAADRVYPGILERLLREGLAAPAADVVPMGVPAYSTWQGRLWLASEIDALQPDLVTILYGFNDTAPGRRDRITLTTSWLRRGARRLVYRSQALTHVLLAMRPLLSRPGTAPRSDGPPRVPAGEYLENIRSMVELARSRGARVVVIGQVYRDPNPERPVQDRRIAENRRALAGACASWGVPWLEVPLLTEAKAADNGSFFVDREHPSPLGHRVLAERLYEVIEERGLLAGASPAASQESKKAAILAHHRRTED